MGQIPNHGSPYGKECRELFEASNGYELVGADASGLELRCLAHFMAKYDGGAYAKELLTGDIHTANQKAAGLPTRNNAKTFIYAFLYGAGDEKIGKVIGKGAKEGAEIKATFLRKTPALRCLRDAVKAAAKERGYLFGLDGRRLPIRSEHAALNTLLQSAGAIAVKQATILLMDRIKAEGLDAHLVAHVHDEVQLEVRKGLGEKVGKMAVQAIQDAGKHFNFRCPLDGEYRVGGNWSETH
jgi:DNA polymerase I-like protein with 3'-5' exonuclease and polymerase domains